MIQARELYRSSAARASVLYFILNDLNRINPMYQFSLKAFSVVFDVAIKVNIQSTHINLICIFPARCHGLECGPSSEKSHRLHHFPSVPVHNKVCNDCFKNLTALLFIRGLFECDKLIFTAQMAFQILLMKDEINPLELDFLLR